MRLVLGWGVSAAEWPTLGVVVLGRRGRTPEPAMSHPCGAAHGGEWVPYMDTGGAGTPPATPRSLTSSCLCLLPDLLPLLLQPDWHMGKSIDREQSEGKEQERTQTSGLPAIPAPPTWAVEPREGNGLGPPPPGAISICSTQPPTPPTPELAASILLS